MIDRIRDAIAPPRTTPVSERGYRKLLKWAALPVTDRRWAAPLSAVALGFGLFAGVAIGPGAAGSLATAPYQVIEIPSFGGAGDDGGEEEVPLAVAPESGGGFGGEGESSAGFVPVAPVEEEPVSSGEESPEEETAPEGEAEPQQPEKQKLTGTVVHVNPAAASYTVAETGGTMSTVHAGKLPSPATQVEVPIETLANGTLAEAGKRRKTGTKASAKLAGIVTFVNGDPAAPAYTVSNKGTSALVKVHPDPSGAMPALPVLGAYASVTVEIEPLQPAASASAAQEEPPTEPAPQPPVEPAPEPQPPVGPAPPPLPPPSAAVAPAPVAPTCAPDPSLPPPAPVVAPRATLWQGQISGGGAPYTSATVEGIVEAVCPTTAQLLISADDIRESGHDLLIAVPANIDTNGLTVGSSILANADIAAEGVLTLTGLASDQRLKGADDAKATQGDLVGAKKPKE